MLQNFCNKYTTLSFLSICLSQGLKHVLSKIVTRSGGFSTKAGGRGFWAVLVN